MKNTLPPEIESLCVQNIDGQIVPLWPYVVAVTGHRFFAKPGEVEGLPVYDRETIKNAFRKELEQMARRWKESCNKKSILFKNKEVNAPFIVLTGMADGADQLAAEVALELPAELNVKVAAVLPMDKELFRLTITDKERYDDLLNRVYMTYTLPLPDNSPEYRAKIADVNNHSTADLREKQYNYLGKFLALHSHVLFAFWDGIDMPNLVGGTSTVLHFKLEGNTEKQIRSDILTYTSVGPVVHFLIPRNNEENRKRKDSLIQMDNPDEIPVFYWSKRDLWDEENKCYFFPDRQRMTEERRCKTSVSNMKEVVDTLERIGELNWYSINCPTEVKEQLPQSEKYLFEKRSPTDVFCDAETKALINHYAYVDALAGWFQSRMKSNVFRFLLGVGGFLVFSWLISLYWDIRQNGWGATNFLSFVQYGQNTLYEIFSWNTWTPLKFLTLLYGISIFAFTAVYIKDWLKKDRIRFYRFRAVAEALRVQIFWRIAEMTNCVSGHYRTHQLHETEWLRTAINGLDALLDSPKSENFDKNLKERLTFIRDVWINGQLTYFQMKLANGEVAHSFYQLKFVGPFLRLFKSWEQYFGSKKFVALFLLLWLVLILVVPIMPVIMKSIHAYSEYLAVFAQVLYGFILIIIPICGLIKFWMNAKTPQSDLDRYKQMLFPYDRAILLLKPELESTEPLESEDKIMELQTILCQLGTEAVAENASWYLSLGERELTLPR